MLFDFTLVTAVRLHDGNPWVAERLRRIGRYYTALPPVIVVDFGSEEQFATTIQDICKEHDFQYVHVPDHGVFSLAQARNAAVEHVKTPLIFFTDPDFFLFRNSFERLQGLSKDLHLCENMDRIINLPAYHLSKATTEAFDKAEDSDAFLNKLAFNGLFEKFGGSFEFVAPYSNIFLIHKDYLKLVGGWNAIFRGHGSEDFDFLLRAMLLTGDIPLANEPGFHGYGPTKGRFFHTRAYRGYRRMLEVLSLPAELSGLKAFHLWHDRNKSDQWFRQNDWKRDNLTRVMEPYLQDRRKLLEQDFLPTSYKPSVLCIIKDPAHYEYHLPLKSAGYKLITMGDFSDTSLKWATKLIKSRAIDALAIYNPYMKSHSRAKPLFDLAKQLGLETLVIERGALPSTIYYADDICYASEDFSKARFKAYEATPEHQSGAKQYMAQLRKGADTLEANAPYAATLSKYPPRTWKGKPTCFIPLQLEDDTAVTLFNEGFESYQSFLDQLPQLCNRHKDTTFVIKPHPLSKQSTRFEAPNVVWADQEDNIHCLLELAQAVICYNSGVGLLALLHGKPTITIGNAFYNLVPNALVASSTQHAFVLASNRPAPPNQPDLEKLCAWFLYQRYSRFTADLQQRM
ncbi:glycosyltransferase [Pseudovibrio exalbescens]|uniref:capsular polysaccharide export protein, LipB/KpsS family n=1 Tax=Pseudovibrio exalbescens TaxID=197461 RepID=UPI002366BFD9|nr:glycosyltransferase [Pseudovibrio exalbescens]MDD7910777.1 glycosyltransferase [Pseudovibrio exalbescens]